MSNEVVVKEINYRSMLVDGVLPVKPKVTCPVESYLLELRSALSKRQQKSRLNVFARMVMQNETATCHDVPWSSIDRETLNQVMNHMKESGSAHSSINGLLAAVKGVLKAGYEHGILPYERFRQVSSVKSYHLGDQLSRRRDAIDIEEISQLMAALERDPTPWGLRDHAMFNFMINTGARRAEVVELQLKRLDLRRSVAVVLGKGGYQRPVAFPPRTKQLLLTWINECRGDEPGSLFCPITPDENIITCRSMAPESINRILKLREAEANLPSGTIKPHDLRRTFASMYLAQNPDLLSLRDILGHKSVSTTEIYDRRKEEATLQAMRDFDILGS